MKKSLYAVLTVLLVATATAQAPPVKPPVLHSPPMYIEVLPDGSSTSPRTKRQMERALQHRQFEQDALDPRRSTNIV